MGPFSDKRKCEEACLSSGSRRDHKLAQRKRARVINEIDMFKKRIREMKVSFKEKKTFRSGYSRNQRDQIKCFCVVKPGILLEIVSVKEAGIISR